MFDKFTKKAISFVSAVLLAMSNITSVYAQEITTKIKESKNAAEAREDIDLTHQTIELYPDEESSEKTVTLEGLMPEGAEAVAVDVSDSHDGVAAYDISIKDGKNEYQPGEEHPIKVEIVDPVITENITLWHIHDDGTREQVLNFAVEDGKVSFYATGFSVYEIVDGEIDFKIECSVVPVTGNTSSFDTYTVTPVGAKESFTYDVVSKVYPQLYGTATQITSLADFKANIASGFYIKSNSHSTYAKNYQCVIKGTRTGIAITPSYSDSNQDINMFNAYSNGAAKFYFEEVNPDNPNTPYYIYTLENVNDPDSKKYVGWNTDGENNNLHLTANKNDSSYPAAEWTVNYGNDGLVYFKVNGEDRFWTSKNDSDAKGFANYTTNNAGEKFTTWLYTPPSFETDPYGLDGNTYCLVSYKNAANGNALLAGNYNNGVTQLGNFTVSRAVDGETNAVSYSSDYGITGWKFEWVEGTTKYKISAIADDGATRKYLKVDSSGLSLVADAADASEIQVTPDSNNRIQLSANGYKINNNNNSFNASTNSTTVFDLVDISSATADSLGLNDKTYAIIGKNNDITGNAMSASIDRANTKRLDNQPIERSGDVYIYTGELSGWTFSNVDTNRYIISNGSKYLKLVNGSLILSDDPFILTVVAGEGDNAGKISIRNITDRRIIIRNKNENFYDTVIDANVGNSDRWLELSELPTPPESDPFGLDGKTYGIMNKSNDTTGYSMTYDAGSTSQLNGKKADYVSGETKYKSYGAPVGWTFHWQGYANYKISVDTGGGIIKWLKFNNLGVSVVDESEATIFNISTGTGDYAGKIRICPVLDNAISSITRSNSGSEYFFQRGTSNNPNGQYWHDLVKYDLNDPYKLNGKKFSLMHYISGASGHALTASDAGNSLNMMTCIVRPESGSNTKVLYVAMDTDITEWTFENAGEDKYYIYAAFGGTKKYLRINDDSIVAEETETPQVIQVRPDENGRIMLSADGYSVKYQANTENQNENGRFVSASGDGDYLYFVSQTEIDDKQLITYKAKEVSVSEVKNGEQVIIYTRVWNGSGYDFCAIDHNGNLVPCYERGDSIMWLSNKVNTMLWDFTECYYEYTDTPNHYYRLYNPYSGKYLAPKRSSGMTLSDTPIGINLEGRRYGEYYSTILAWDQQSYAYSGLKAYIEGSVDGGNDDIIIPSARAKADTFYFARVVDYTNDLTEVETVDNTQHGITMRMVNFSDKSDKTLNSDKHNEQDHILGDYTVWENHQLEPKSNILSTDLKDDGYPTSKNPDNNPDSSEHTTHSLSELYHDTTFVNHLFIQSILEQSGYFEFDSCQNYATLKNQVQSQTEEGKKLYVVIENGKEIVKEYGASDTVPDGAKPIYDFLVSKEIGTHDSTSKPSLQHGQFYPYDDIDMDTYAVKNSQNLYDALQNPLKDSDPRKYEKLHLIEDPDYYFGMQLDASFTQTPDGKDDWGHDIIFEFTGDDDFWLYVDGELVIDLGGIHSALGGNVNFATGDVVVNGVPSNLRDVFASNYKDRGMTDEQIIEELKNHFDYDKSITNLQITDFEKVFKDYTSHDMKIFYMERGAGASNIHMRFNLNYVTPGDVIMTKELTGSDDVDFDMVEYPFQIWYSDEEDANHNVNLQSIHLLTPNDDYINVKYQNSTRDVIYQESYTPPGSSEEYDSVYFINPHQSVEIHFPENTTYYMIKECGINSSVYEHVFVNGVEVTGVTTNITNSPLPERKTFASDWQRVSDRTNIVFTNQVNPDALRPLYFQKKLYDADYSTNMSSEEKEQHKITAEQDPTRFSFRLYLSNGITNERTLTNMVKYRVISPDGYYCTWNTATQSFDESQYTSSVNESDVNSLKNALKAISDNEELTAEERAEQKEELLEKITFETSINGQISEISAWYTVEVPNIPVGVTFEVEERDSAAERPLGYDRVQYERREGTYLTIDGEKDNVGIVRASDTPTMNVINKRGYEIEAEKSWTDRDFALGHDNIYIALYVKKTDGTYELANSELHPVRMLKSPGTQIRYFMESLGGKALSDYTIFEVTLTGDLTVDENGYVTGYNDIIRITNGEFANINATDRITNSEKLYKYAVTYESGEAVNPLSSIHAKKSWSADENSIYTALCIRQSNGTYKLADSSLAPVRKLIAPNITVHYFIPKLAEETTADDYKIFEIPVTSLTDPDITVDSSGYVDGYTDSDVESIINGSSLTTLQSTFEIYTARSDKITNTRQGGIVIDLYKMGTRNIAGNIIDVGSGETAGEPLQGGVFKLEVETVVLDPVTNQPIIDQQTNKPVKKRSLIGNYTSDADGKITIMYNFERIADIDNFEEGICYVLTQISSPVTYIGLPEPVKFAIGVGEDPDIRVIGNEAKWNSYHKLPGRTDEVVAYIDVYNKPFTLKAVKVDSQDKEKKLEGVHFALYRGVNSVDGLIPDNSPISGCEDLVTNSKGVIPDVTEHLRDGTYFLRETQALGGYRLFANPIRFSIHENDIVLVNEAGGAVITDHPSENEEVITSNSGVQLIKKDDYEYECELRIPNEKDESNYYFDIEKIIFVDKNIHDSDKEQKFVFKVDRFDENTSDFSDDKIKSTFYITMNCDNEIVYTSDTNIKFAADNSAYNYSIYHNATATNAPKYEFISSENGVDIKRTYDTDNYTFPTAIWSGRKTVHVKSEGIYRITEVANLSSTDYDFWKGSNVYKGYGDSNRNGNLSSDGFRDSTVEGENAVYINVAKLKADMFETESASIGGETMYRPTASFTNTETEYAYLSSQAYAENTFKRSST